MLLQRAATALASIDRPLAFLLNSMDSPSVRAPDFPDTLDWVHSGGRKLTLADFRGKLLLLDFWTYG